MVLDKSSFLHIGSIMEEPHGVMSPRRSLCPNRAYGERTLRWDLQLLHRIAVAEDTPSDDIAADQVAPYN